MTARTAACRCGAVTLVCEGEPIRVSVCHCLDCQRRSGSAFAAQARWPEAQVTITGEPREWEYAGHSGWARFAFCATCGSPTHFRTESFPDVIAVPVGAFADPSFTAPRYSVWEERKHAWLDVTGNVEHHQ